MRRIVVDIPESLASARIAGRTVREHWAAVLEEAGVVGADGEATRLDGRLLALSPETVRRIALSEPYGPGDLLVPDEARIVVEHLGDLARAEALVVRRVVAALGRRGVVLHDPERIWVEATVDVAPGATLWGGCVLRGRTRVAGGAEVQTGAVLVDTVVGEDAVVKPYSVCEGATIGPDSQVGPMAHLRPGAELRRDVKVGNFVEVKQAVLHDGVRASHLTYLGDAEVFEDANVGAGTITCNYDGWGKHRTVIGEGAFVGSNTALVAPVRVGRGAIVGAGSTITRDVPDDCVAIERAEQRNLEGRAPLVHERNRRRAGK